jgi:hypothetical protein
VTRPYPAISNIFHSDSKFLQAKRLENNQEKGNKQADYQNGAPSIKVQGIRLSGIFKKVHYRINLKIKNSQFTQSSGRWGSFAPNQKQKGPVLPVLKEYLEVGIKFLVSDSTN